jgi:hypothetical protein
MIIHNPQSGSSSSISSSPPLIHFIFLVHGYKGMSADLSYLQHNLKSIIEQRVFENTTNNNNNNLSPPYKVVIHNAVSNELRTKDGVGPGVRLTCLCNIVHLDTISHVFLSHHWVFFFVDDVYRETDFWKKC